MLNKKIYNCIMTYVTPGKASEYYKVTTVTLRQWAEDGKIECTRTEGGHRRFWIPEQSTEGKRNIIYTRVSSNKQKGDLQNQTDYLKGLYPNYEIISDIGSGLNFKRQGFRSILEHLFEYNIGEVIVATSDRFSRFGARDFFEWLFRRFEGKLTILGESQYENPNQELSEDLLEIITVFTARYYGRRSYSNNKKNKDISESSTEETF